MMAKVICALFMAALFCGCAKVHEVDNMARRDTRTVFEKAHDDIMKLDRKIRENMW